MSELQQVMGPDIVEVNLELDKFKCCLVMVPLKVWKFLSLKWGIEVVKAERRMGLYRRQVDERRSIADTLVEYIWDVKETLVMISWRQNGDYAKTSAKKWLHYLTEIRRLLKWDSIRMIVAITFLQSAFVGLLATNENASDFLVTCRDLFRVNLEKLEVFKNLFLKKIWLKFIELNIEVCVTIVEMKSDTTNMH